MYNEPADQIFKETSFGLVWKQEGRGETFFQIFGMLGLEGYEMEIAAGREVMERVRDVYCLKGDEIENLQIIEYEHSDELGCEEWYQFDPWFWGNRKTWGFNPRNRKFRPQIIFKRAVTETELARKDNPAWARLLEIRLDMYGRSPVHLKAIITIQAGFREARARRLRDAEDSDAGWSLLEVDSGPETDPNNGQSDRNPDANADIGDSDRELGADTAGGEDDRETVASEASLGYTTDSDTIQEETTDTDSIQEEDSNDDDAQSQPKPDSDDDALDLSFTSEEEKDDNSENDHENDNDNDHAHESEHDDNRENNHENDNDNDLETEHENEGEHENDNEYDADVDSDAGPDVDFDTDSDTDSDNENEQFNDPEPNAPRAYPEDQPRPMREVGAYGVRLDQRVGTSQYAEINAVNRNRLAASTADSIGDRFTPRHYDFSEGGPREQDFEDVWEENYRTHGTFQLGAAIQVQPFTNAAVYTAYLPKEEVMKVGHKLQGTTMLKILVPKNFGGLFTGFDGENIKFLRFEVEGVRRFILVDFNQKLVIAMKGKDRAKLMLRVIGETIMRYFDEVTRGRKVSKRALAFMKRRFNQ